jgi:hypothetical protein
MKKIPRPNRFLSLCLYISRELCVSFGKKTWRTLRLVFLHIINTPVDWSKLNKEQEDLFP